MKHLIRLALSGIALVAMIGISHAETPPLTQPTTALNNSLIRTSYRLKNIKASAVAYRLDPANHPVPLEIFSGSSRELYSQKPIAILQGAESKVDALPEKPRSLYPSLLPKGITRIVPVDPQNLLLAQGTAEGLKNLDSLVAVLDRPFWQLELEVRAVSGRFADLKLFGFPSAIRQPDNPYSWRDSVALAPADVQDQLKKLVDEGKVKVIAAPTLPVAVSNDSLEVESYALFPPPPVDNSQPQSIPIPPLPNLKIKTSIGANNEVQLNVEPYKGEEGSAQTKVSDLIPNYSLALKDGETLAIEVMSPKPKIPLLGDIPILDGQFRTSTKTLILLALHIKSAPEAPFPPTQITLPTG